MQKKIPTTMAILVVLAVAAIALFAIMYFTSCEDERALLEIGRYLVK